MTLSLPFSPVSGVDVGQSMENICQPFEQQGRWPFGADLNADLSAYTRQRPLAMPGGVGVYSSNMAEVVRYAPGELIEKNAFHLELKLTLGQRDQEIVALNEANIAQKKEFDDLKARYETLDGMHRMTMEQFASEYHELKAASGNGPKPLTLVGVLPLPKIKTREACPEIVQWNRDVYLRSTASAKAQKRGETDGNAITVKKKAKAGRPPKTADDVDDDSHGHLYLENLDVELQGALRLVHAGLTTVKPLRPGGRSQMSLGNITSGVYSTEPGLEFLQYCDDGLWKLREWTQQSYSGWARNHGIRGSQPRQKDAQEGLEEGGLDDPKLIRISPDKEDDDINGNWGGEGHQATDNADNEENDNNDKNTHDEGAETSDGNSTPIPSPSVVKFSRRKPFVIRAFDILVLVTNSHPSPSAPAPVDYGHKRRDQRTYGRQLCQYSALGSNCVGPAAPTAHYGDGQCSHRPRAISRTPRLHPDQVPPPVLVGPATKDPETTPTETDVVNIRLERTRLGANNEKKRKPDNKTPSASTKKQKTSTVLAIPPDGNSIKYDVPAYEGPDSEIDAASGPQPFKKEMRIIQLANRKAKAITKTTVNPTPAN
ncbi:hypothetical protein EDB89DRAFT_1903094 [Lactarius sanguifluus]|nr:hypothetical protein EDB89DRAFT_1903094 [Lactarius sanguifluus]